MTVVERVDPADPDPAVLARAAACLRAGGLVAFPTETVYGLGVHALDRAAVGRLFAAKGRPTTDPLIVHVADAAQAEALAAQWPDEAQRLAARFWPGPLTIVVPKAGHVPDEITAGLASVAIRVPAHPVALALLRAVAAPIAAPSANLFSRPSPTCAEHVLADLNGRIDMVLDAGFTPVGVESTVVDVSSRPPRVLRPGGTTIEALTDSLGEALSVGAASTTGGAQMAPGLLERHYAPRTPMTVYEGELGAVMARITTDATAAAASGRRVGLLLADESAALAGLGTTRFLGPLTRPDAVAVSLYAVLREIDAAGVDVILAHGMTDARGLGAAVRDRLRRAASGRVVIC